MTLTEFSDEFDIQYDSIAGKSAPGIDLYEKSVYLTKAQLELIKNRYSPKSNPKAEGFEASEKRRVDLKELIKNYNTSQFFKTADNIHHNAVFVNLPEDLFLTVHEHVTLNDCNLDVEVVPVTYDEFNIQIKNPFKQPNTRKVWRLDFSKQAGQNTFELLTTHNPSNIKYSVRYIKYPKPIIIADLNQEFPNEGLTIEGISTMTPCELNKELHPEILNRAVELAMGDYRAQRLSTKVQLDNREE